MRVWFVKIGSFDDLLEKTGPQSFSHSYNWFSLYWSTSKPIWNFLCLLKVTTVCKKTKKFKPHQDYRTQQKESRTYTVNILLNISFIHKRWKIRIILIANCQRHYHSGLIKARIWLKEGQPHNTWAKLRKAFKYTLLHIHIYCFYYLSISSLFLLGQSRPTAGKA